MSPPTTENNANSFTDLETTYAPLDPTSFTEATKALFDIEGRSNGNVRRSQVEARIVELENEVRVLKNYLNTATTTGRLPPEILSHIFLELSLSAIVGNSTSQRLSWVRLTHVCRHWRGVALNCPALWSNLSVAHEVWADLMLSRSKQAPLSVDLSIRETRCGPQAFKALLSKIYSHGTRLRTLKLCVSEGDMLSDFPPTVPNLQTLALTINVAYSTKAQLPAHVLAGGAPALEHLEVVGFTLPWKVIPSAPKLTFLKLFQLPKADRLSPLFLAESIGQMPALQDLDIKNFLPPGPLSAPIDLPSLKSLTSVDELPPVANFVQSCAPFQAERIDFQMTGTFPTIEAISSFFANLTNRWKNPATDRAWAETGIQALHLKGMDSNDRKLVLEAYYRPYDPHDKSKPDLHLTLPVSKALVPKVLSAFAESFNLNTIQWLTIALNDDCLGKSWKYIAMLGSLETLYFSGGDTILGFVSSLGEKWAKSFFASAIRRPGTNSSGKPLFPALTTIKCRDVDFDLDRQGLGEDNANELAKLLKRWPTANPLRELHLDLCLNFTDDDYAHLQEEASRLTIDWDGVEDISSEAEEYDDEDMYDEFMMYHDAFDDYDYDSDYF